MLDPAHPIARLLEEDKRYTVEAYAFLFEALHYAQEDLGMGDESPSEPIHRRRRGPPTTPEAPAAGERHVTGRELCEAIRRYALEQYGLMAKTVLNSWGLRCTGDFGEIVFNLIRVGQMRKTPSDLRVDFDDIFDFDVAFKQEYKFTPSE